MNNLQVQKIINEVVKIVNNGQEVGNPVKRVLYLPAESATGSEPKFIIQYEPKTFSATDE